MKFLKTVVIATLLFSTITGFALDAQQMLTQAMADSREMSFKAEIINPFPEESIHKIILPRTPRWVFYRQYDDGELSLRLEMYDANNALQMVYLHNSTGNYGTFDQKKGCKITAVPYLWFPEELNAEIMAEELNATFFALSEITYNGVPCFEIVTTLEDDEATLLELSHDIPAMFEQQKELYLANRVFTRRFIIDKTSNQIISRRHYNRNGEEISVCELDSVDYNANIKDSLFKTPKLSYGEFLSWQTFANIKLYQMQAPQEVKKVDFNLMYRIIYIVIGVIVLLLVALVVMQLRKRRA